ncbi:ER membrane protein DP1/Yop1, partial [Cladochytrium tenue]
HYLSKFRTLNLIEARTTVPKVYIALVGYLLVSLSVFLNIFAGFTTGVLGLVYPLYRFLEAGQKGDTEGLKSFGFFFAILSLLTTVEEVFLSTILYYFPFYFVMKLVFVFWLMLPGYQGAHLLYGLVSKQFTTFTTEDPKKQ